MDSPSTNQTGAAGAVRDKPGRCQSEAIRASVSTAGRYLSTGQGRGFSLFDGLATRTTRCSFALHPKYWVGRREKVRRHPKFNLLGLSVETGDWRLETGE